MNIKTFAHVSDWEDRLEQLAGLAEPERWQYVTLPSESAYPVLDSYIRYTFLRLHQQGKVAISEAEDLACFNTGLLTGDQEEIFGVFTVSDNFKPDEAENPRNKKWFLKRWARAGERIMTSFLQLPSIATYWEDPGELIFNPRFEVNLNLDHIVRDNLNRFPEILGGQVDANGVPNDLEQLPDIENETAEEGGEDAQEDENPQREVPLAARNALEGALKHSLRLAERSYRVAVPQFHRGRLQLLLPIYLQNLASPDLALILERHGEWYRAVTVLYPDWAYRHARLLSRPNSEWLGGFRQNL